MYFLGSSYAEYINRLTHLTASIYPQISYMSTVFTPFFYFQQIHQNPAELFVSLSKNAVPRSHQYPALSIFHTSSGAVFASFIGRRNDQSRRAQRQHKRGVLQGKWRSAKRQIDPPVIERFVENMRKHLCYGFVVFDSLKTLPFFKKRQYLFKIYL